MEAKAATQAMSHIDFSGIKKHSNHKQLICNQETKKNCRFNAPAMKEGTHFKIKVEGRQFLIIAGSDDESTMITEIKPKSGEGVKLVSSGNSKKVIIEIEEDSKDECKSVSDSSGDSGESISIDMKSEQTEDKSTGEDLLDEKMARLDVKSLKKKIRRKISQAFILEKSNCEINEEISQLDEIMSPSVLVKKKRRLKKHHTTVNL